MRGTEDHRMYPGAKDEHKSTIEQFNILTKDLSKFSASKSGSRETSLEANAASMTKSQLVALTKASPNALDNKDLEAVEKSPEEIAAEQEALESKKAERDANKLKPENLVKTYLRKLPTDIGKASAAVQEATQAGSDGTVPAKEAKEYQKQFTKLEGELRGTRDTLEALKACQDYSLLDMRGCKAQVVKLRKLLSEWSEVQQVYNPTAA